MHATALVPSREGRADVHCKSEDDNVSPSTVSIARSPARAARARHSDDPAIPHRLGQEHLRSTITARCNMIRCSMIILKCSMIIHSMVPSRRNNPPPNRRAKRSRRKRPQVSIPGTRHPLVDKAVVQNTVAMPRQKAASRNMLGTAPPQQQRLKNMAVTTGRHITAGWSGFLGPYSINARRVRHQLAAGDDAARRDPRQVRRLDRQCGMRCSMRLRPSGRPARRREDLRQRHADGNGAAAARRRHVRPARHAVARAVDGRERLSAAAGDRRDRRRPRRIWSTASIRTICSWSWQRPTARTCRQKLERFRLCRLARRTGARPAGLHASHQRHGQSRRRRSPITGSIRRTSRSAW